MLTEAGLLETVIKAIPNLAVSTSVIRLLREIAREIETQTGTVGRAGFVEGELHFSPIDKEAEDSFRKQLLLSANLLDNLPNKLIAKSYPETGDDKNLDHRLHDCFVDAFRYAQEKPAYILTDDALLIQAYRLGGETRIPKHCSSLSLVRAMVEDKLISWDAYLQYFARLSYYRYHLLPVSVEDMIKSIFSVSPSGLVTPKLQNLRLLNLHLTLSQEYGVDDKTAISILAGFFTKVIMDETIPPAIADEIFALTIGQGLVKRDRRLMARTILQICHQNIQDQVWSPQNSQAKMRILEKQLWGFAQGIDPIVIPSTLFLRASHSAN